MASKQTPDISLDPIMTQNASSKPEIDLRVMNESTHTTDLAEEDPLSWPRRTKYIVTAALSCSGFNRIMVCLGLHTVKSY
jgi:hypothetical protein